MKIRSVYFFRHSEEFKSVYLFEEMQGEAVKNFPAVYIQGKNKGLKYIRIADPSRPALKEKFEEAIYCGKTYLTGLNFSKIDPLKAYGDDKNIGSKDCLLVEFSEEREKVKIYFLENMADKKDSEEVFEKWLNGDILELDEKEKAVNQ